MRKMLETAKMYALSEHAVMIYGQAGTEDYLLAEAIHNNSIRKVGPYVSINMREWIKNIRWKSFSEEKPEIQFQLLVQRVQ
ncbi:MAG: sigma 54-interacting transcriptional regulator [Mediterraneibacter faecis]